MVLEPKFPKIRNPRDGSATSRTVIRYGLMTALCIAAIGCGFASGPEIDIYVDNPGAKPITVSLDGEEVATIEPNACGRIDCDAGERRIKVQCGDKVLFEGKKNLKKSDHLGVVRRYFLDPNDRNRYVIYTVKYGSSPFEGLLKPDEGGAGDRQSEIRAAYQELVKQLDLLPSKAWFEIPAGVLVLQSPPDMVVTSGYTEQRKVMTRVDPKDYAILERAQDNANPSEHDLEVLEEVVERILDSAP
jgi:hypothetical protein